MLFAELKKTLQSLMPSILTHSFNQKLADGSLPISIFNAFLKQDKIYLQAYADALTMIAHRLQNTHPAHSAIFYTISKDARNTEHHLHQKYLKKMHPSCFFKLPSPSKNAAISAYIQHLHDTTQTKPVSVAIAAVLPCFVIYRELGTTMPCDPKHRFHDWIKTYSNPDFLRNAEKMIAIFNAHDQVDLRDQSLKSFTTSIQHEINFWDSVIKPPCNEMSPSHCAGKW